MKRGACVVASSNGVACVSLLLHVCPIRMILEEYRSNGVLVLWGVVNDVYVCLLYNRECTRIVSIIGTHIVSLLLRV